MSLRAFVLNWLGAKVPEDQMLNIEHPRFEVQWYTTMKCMQIGAVLGYAYAMRVPLMRYLGRPVAPTMTRMDMTRYVLRSIRAGLMGGLFLSFPATMAYAYQHRLTDEGYYKRAYELRHNRKQLNLDRGSALVGLGSGVFYKSTLGLPFSLGLSQGVALGSIGVFLYNNYDWLYRKTEDKKDELVAKHTVDKLSNKAHEQMENAKDSLHKVSQKAHDRVEDAKGSLKKGAEDTKDAFKRASEEGKDSLKKATNKAQDYAYDMKNKAKENVNKAQDYAYDMKNKAKENVNKAKENVNEFKNKAKENVNELKNKAKENANELKNKAQENASELKNKAQENVNDFKKMEHK